MLIPTPGEISVLTGNSPHDPLVSVGAPLVRYPLEELTNERLKHAQLSTDLAAADAQSPKIEKAARERETALAVWNGGLRDELAEREAQLACDTATWVFRARLLNEARVAEASARALRQLAAMKTKLEEQGRQTAAVRSVAKDLAQQLGVAEAELKRRESENERLIAELAALRSRISSAAVLEPLTAAPIEKQMDTLPGPPAQHAELLPANSVHVAPTMPHPKPRVRASDLDSRALASGTSAYGAAAPGDVSSGIEGAEWAEAGRREVAFTDWEPTADAIPFAASESRHVPDIMSAVALAPTPTMSGMLDPGEGSLTGLDEAAARIADGLRAAREEAILRQQERVFAVDVDKRAFATSAAESVPLDPTLDISLLTAKSEVIGESTGGIRFFPDGSSTGGRIELELLGNRTAVSVRWSTGAVTLER